MIVADISYAQDPVVPEEMAPRIDALLVRWTDWKAWARGDGDDTYYNFHLRRFRELGVPTSGYFFARPEMAPAVEQIDTWAARTTETFDFPPLLDVEISGISGAPLQEWVEAALARMKAIWGRVPLYYTNTRLMALHGLHPPFAPHLPMIAGYPYKDNPPIRYREGKEDEWVLAAGGPQGFKDYTPNQYAYTAVALWQFCETGHLPGTPNVCDASHPYQPFLDALHAPPDTARIGDLIAILRRLAPIVETGRLAQPIAATALGELRKILTPAAADVLVAGLTGDTGG